MEKVECNYNEYYKLLEQSRQFESNEAKIIYVGDEVWKIQRSITDNSHIWYKLFENLSKLNTELLSLPKKVLYINKELRGIIMDNDGEDLAKLFSENRLSNSQKIDICHQIKEIIKYLKNEKLAHGDIKLANLFYKNGIVKLGDNINIGFNEVPVRMNICSSNWYKKYNNYYFVDELSMNLITYLLFNMENKSLIDYFLKDDLLEHENNINMILKRKSPRLFDKKIVHYEKSFMIGREKDENKIKKRIENSLYLIDHIN